MIIYKIIGGAIITLCSLKCYQKISEFQKRRALQLEAFVLLIEYIKNQIECYLLPVNTILSSCNKDLLYRAGVKEPDKNYENLKELVDNIVFYCDEDVIDIIMQFAEGFGRSYSSEQIKICENCKNELIKIKNKTFERDASNKKVRLAICLCVSFSLIILFF